MLGRQHRFHGYTSLNYVYKHGTTVRDDAISLRIAANARRADYRCAVVVSKKTNKSAVGRNRIRRRIYEIVRHRLRASSPPIDLVVTVHRPDVAAMSTVELDGRLGRLLQKALTAANNKAHGHATINRQEN